MSETVAADFVTPVKWPRVQASYGTEDTYRLAAKWLKDCTDVADWGGAQGFLGTLLPPRVRYTVVDGTVQGEGQVLADLMRYHQPSDGILLRHVLDHTRDWKKLLHNAMDASRRLVVVTFTPPSTTGHSYLIEKKSGWPVWRFDADEMRAEMGTWLVRDDDVQTSHSERVYFLQKP